MNDEVYNSPTAGPLVEATYKPPRAFFRSIQRTTLLTLLGSQPLRPITLLYGPAGFGKSTVMKQWFQHLQEAGSTTVWLNLQNDFAESRIFLSHLIRSLAYSGVDTGTLGQLAEQELVELNLSAVVSMILECLANHPAEVIVFLDDYHSISSDEVNHVLEQVMVHLPSSTQLVISMRQRADMNTAMLKAQGIVREVDQEALRFAFDEAQELFAPHIDSTSLQSIYVKTEGWPIALQLARFWIDNGKSQEQIVGDVSAAGDDIAEFFTRMIYVQLPEELQLFLLQTSILDEFDSAICDFVCARENSNELLSRINQWHLLISHGHGQRETFRYHNLLSEFLRNEFHSSDPDGLNTVHSRAADWYMDRGRLSKATRHACEADDTDKAARFIIAAGGWELVFAGRSDLLNRVVKHFPSNKIADFPRLELANIYRIVRNGEVVRANRRHQDFKERYATALVDKSERTAKLRRDAKNLDIIMAVYADHNTTRACLRRYVDDVADISAQDYLALLLISTGVSVVAIRTGEFQRAYEYAKLAQFHSRESHNLIGLAYSYLHLGQAEFHLGALRSAIATLEDARELAEENFGVDSTSTAMAKVLVISAKHLTSERLPSLSVAEENLANIEQEDGWFNIYSVAYDTTATLAYEEGGLEAALSFIQRGQKKADSIELRALADLLYAKEVWLLCLAGETERAQAKLDTCDSEYISRQRADHYRNWYSHHIYWYAVGLLAIDTGRAEEAVGFSETLHAVALENNHLVHQVEALLLKAMALSSTNQDEAACDALIQAVSNCVNEGIFGPFRQLAYRIEPLLTDVYRRRRTLQIGSLVNGFINNLLQQLRDRDNESHPEEVLTNREREVMQELAQGYSNKQIARALDMTENTVKFHLKQLFLKLGVNNRSRAVIIAQKRKLLG
ncbi:MAG: LuxR C-terminal-related transcriptional regulator [Pseudomonadota bacterium]